MPESLSQYSVYLLREIPLSEIHIQIVLGCMLGGQFLRGGGPQFSVSRDLAEQGNGAYTEML
jgi:hypothetical protein